MLTNAWEITENGTDAQSGRSMQTLPSKSSEVRAACYTAKPEPNDAQVQKASLSGFAFEVIDLFASQMPVK